MACTYAGHTSKRRLFAHIANRQNKIKQEKISKNIWWFDKFAVYLQC